MRLSRPSVIGRTERSASLPPSLPPSTTITASPLPRCHHPPPIASPREPFTALPLPGCSFSAVAAVCTPAACAALSSLHPDQHLAVFHRGEARVPRSWKVSLYLSPSLPPSLTLSHPALSSSSSSPAANPNREVLTTFLLPQSATRYLAALPCESHKGRGSATVPHCMRVTRTESERESELVGRGEKKSFFSPSLCLL